MEKGKREIDHPWLLITDDSRNGEKQFLYCISQNRFHSLLAPELEGCMNVLASAYGWLVLSNPETDYTYIWNPISMEKIDIGTLKFSFLFNKCVMSKPPSEPDCQLVFYSTDGVNQAFCRLVDDEIVLPLSYMGDDAMLLAATAFRGTIYGFLVKPRYGFVTVHFGEETVEYRPILKGDDQRPWDMPWPTREWALRMDYHMIESPCGKELLLVHKMFLCNFVEDEFDFRVFRVDVDRKECEELGNIGDRAMFLSHRGGGFCCMSSSDGSTLFRRNCIYYTIEKGESRCVYVYDLNDRSISSFLPCPVTSRTRSQSCWVQKCVFPN